MRIAIYGHALPGTTSGTALRELIDILKSTGISFMVYRSFLKEAKLPSSIPSFESYKDLKSNVDFLFSIGGDGTLLETVTLIRDSGIPVMGINTGRLGFLSSISASEMEKAVAAIKKKKFSLDKRMLLEMDIKGSHFKDCRYALNEIAVQKTTSSSMLTVHASLNKRFLNTYWSDGLIVATPTGSTAYSLSCGGPVVLPGSKNMVITPVAPHNLNVRPMVISSEDEVVLEVESRASAFLLSLDSRSENINRARKVTIRKAPFEMALVKLEGQDFLSALRSKLMWGLDKRN